MKDKERETETRQFKATIQSDPCVLGVRLNKRHKKEKRETHIHQKIRHADTHREKDRYRETNREKSALTGSLIDSKFNVPVLTKVFFVLKKLIIDFGSKPVERYSSAV